MILITHDRSLMELVADRLWMVADGTVSPFDGDMDDYAKFVLDRARIAARGPAKTAPVQAPAPQQPRVAVGPLKRKLEAAEAALARETRLMEELDATLASPTLYVKDPTGVADLAVRRERLAERLAKAEQVWIEAAEVYEAAVSEGQIA